MDLNQKNLYLLFLELTIKEGADHYQKSKKRPAAKTCVPAAKTAHF